MQPQSDKQSASRLATTTTTSHTTATAAAAAAATSSSAAAAHGATPPKVKVIKSKRPLCHFKFYLDICDHQLAKRIESDIKALGGHLEFFLSDNITHFITDKPEVSGNSGGAPGTPSTPTNHYQQEDGSARKPNQRQSRADAILSRVRRSTVGVGPNNSNSINSSTPTTSVKRSYTIWQTDYAQRFIKRIQTELKQYLEGKKEGGGGGGGAATASPHHIQLKKQYVKIESVKRNYRPYYHLIKQPDDWPKIDLSSEDGAFRLLTKSKTKEKDQSMTRKSLGSHRTSQTQKEKPTAAQEQPPKHPAVQQLKKQSVAIPNSPRSNYREAKDSSEKQGGVCEICKLEYDILNIHLQSKDHELFAKNSENFLALDTLILSSANVNQFLAEEPEESELDMDVDETLSNEDQQQQQSPRCQRPSPALREKSKRITKGKHSSEKFQAAAAASPQTPSPAGKKASLSELQRQEHPTTAAATPTTTNSGRRKTTNQNSGLSPPIRAMLPPSSLYKVVETREECATPPRRGRPPNQTDSPSLIVKFQKIRQTELQRLNGEAENFMFPRTAVTTTTTTRSSSELPTDVDRQTTSDVRGRYSISSASLDTSTSEAETKESSGLLPATMLRKRAQAVGRRRKIAGAAAAGEEQLLQRQLSTGSSSSNSNNNNQQQQQRFPSAPIQPEEQEPPQPQQSQPKLKIKLKQTQMTVVTATRKSSRTATAIVTAATASSRQQQQLRQTAAGGGRRMTTNLEDRMGESVKPKIKIKKEIIITPEEDEDEDEEEELQELEEHLLEENVVDSEEEMELELDSSLSSGSDEDYIASNRSRTTKAVASTRKSTDTREQRAARRLSRLTINRSAGETDPIEAKLSKSSPTRRSRGKSQKPTSPAKSSKSKQPKAVPQSVDLVFDCSKSERLQQMQYTFESLPSAELWNQVFLRQDAGEEHYYTYYGSTRYRKLPYEMGPIPMARTLPAAHSCALCRGEQKEEEAEAEQKEQRQEDLTIKPAVAKKEIKREEEAAQSSSSSSMYKHKKLHLLQRYQQEQEQLQQQQQQQLEGNALATATAIAAKCDSKASTPELLEREFASAGSGSLGDRVQLIERVRSTSSSSCSNSQRSGITCRNKQISRITELPPRKSPREHASTLALVSCIIRQRQDSQSKTNSEAEEPPPPAAAPAPKLKTPLKQETVVAPSSPRTTRSQAATPVEELRFATEISETVKRMRRGQNKYDHSPPAPTPTGTSSPARSRRLTPAAAVTQTLAPSYSRRLEFSTSQRESSSAVSLLLGKGKGKRRGAAANPPAAGTVRPPAQQPPGMGGVFRGVRKLPSKKGLLEYDMEPCALKALDKAMQYTNPGFAAWQLDKYLELAGKEYDLEEEPVPVPEPVTEGRREQRLTPPPTDCCFTSEFDLYDLLLGSAGSGDDDEDLARGNLQTGSSRRMSSQNLYATYYRKRKNLKSNRTGWPKSQRRRNGGGLLGRSLPNERINFLKMGLAEFHPIKQEPMETEEEQTTTTTTTTTSASREKLLSKEDEDDEGGGNPEGGGGGEDEGESPAGDKQNPRQDVVMTPPATDIDELAEPPDADDNESLPEEDETMADSVDQQQDDEAEIEATDADVEEEEEEDDDEEEEDDVFEDAYDEPQVGIKKKEEPSPEKRTRIPSISVSTPPEEHSTPGKKLLLTLHNGQRLQATSTPSTGQQVQQQQQQRRTPQLNGSLGSCISPSEKLGDNSDIFTVSSDGLDTDLDLSNTQAGDSHEQQCPHQTTTTPKRKFDISKYAPPNNGKAASSCAAEAATAAVKSLAISQFLKKEVRVTCRRLRAPFRRFRYRR